MGRSNTGSSANYLTNASAVVTAPPFTIAGWFKATSTTQTQCVCTVKGSGGANYCALAFDGANAYGFGAGRVIADQSGVTTAFTPGAITDTTTWHHLALVYASTTSLIAYLDGTPGSAVNPNVAVSGFNETDGGMFPPNYSILNGAISDVAAWNTALTGTQITSLAGSGGGAGMPFRRALRPVIWRLIGP